MTFIGINTRRVIAGGQDSQTAQQEQEEPDPIACIGSQKRKIIIGGVGGWSKETAINLTESSKSIYEDTFEP